MDRQHFECSRQDFGVVLRLEEVKKRWTRRRRLLLNMAICVHKRVMERADLALATPG
jgi:hypothetical protein